MDKAIKSNGQLKKFVEHFQLSDEYSNIDFIGNIQLETDNNFFNDNARVLIFFNGFDSYGKVDLISDDLDATEYPIQFEAKFQLFEFVDNVYLKTTGRHPNPYIGEYTLKISI
ncbi:hypothetical protein JXM83_00070 [Candidatus Woesearchaeota archaeon]|nr:hypothetical protein [Candidatus Delongbacteria bacterium]MBN2880427.1 hypothetical protein [Candidatus Woesearchaeota archaeon]